MAFEPARTHDSRSVHSNTQPKIINMDETLGYYISCGMDVPTTHHSHHPPRSSAPYAFQTEYSPPDLTPPGLWSFSPAADSPTYSTETESNEDDDDFMACLDEQMSHLMLENDDENELDSPADISDVRTSNALPLTIIPPSAQSQPYWSWWKSDGWQNSNSLLDVNHFLPKCSSHPDPYEDASLELLHSGIEGVSAFKTLENMNSLSEISRQRSSEELAGRKIEEFLWRQAMNQTVQLNAYLPTSSSNVHCGSKSKPSYGPQAYGVSSKLWEKTYNNQRLYSGHSSQPMTRNIAPQQQSGMGRINIQSNRASYQHCARVLNPVTPSKFFPNLNNGSSIRAAFRSRNGNGRESAGTGVFLPRIGISNASKRKRDHSPAFLNVSRFSMENSRPPANMEFYTHQESLKSYTGSSIHQPSEAVLNLPIEWTY